MSFGFPDIEEQPRKIVSNAIENVNAARNGSVLFLASAGNLSTTSLNFPANHKDVIPIYATDANGRFLPNNPAHPGRGSLLQTETSRGPRLGTYGSDIPTCITEEIYHHFDGLDTSAGTSISTAIAAGIAAVTLSYTAALPVLLKCEGLETECVKLHTKEGMERMLHEMSTDAGYMQRFLHPIFFWTEGNRYARPLEVFKVVCRALQGR